PRLREVLLDGGKVLEPTTALPGRLLQRPVLEEFFPVDLACGSLGLLPVARPFTLRNVAGFLRVGAHLARAAPRLRLVLGKNGIVVELLADFLDDLESGQLEQTDRLL